LPKGIKSWVYTGPSRQRLETGKNLWETAHGERGGSQKRRTGLPMLCRKRRILEYKSLRARRASKLEKKKTIENLRRAKRRKGL